MTKPTDPDYQLDTPVPPVKRKTGFWSLLKECIRTGGPGYLQFAITNVCNAHCDFCGFSVDRFDPKTRRSVTLQEAYDTIDISVKNGIGFLLFVGGEPMAHKDLPSMLKYAADSGIQPMICTNGSLWTDENIRMYARLGLTSVIMSIDAPSVELHEKNRGLKGVCEKIARANKLFRQLGVESVASITASRLIDDYTRLPPFLTSLGFDRCTFSYPISVRDPLESSYLSFSDSNLVDYTVEELIEVFQKQPRDYNRQPAGIPQGNGPPPPQGAGSLPLPGRLEIFLSGLEPGPLPLPLLAFAHVQNLRFRRLQTDPRPLHRLHDRLLPRPLHPPVYRSQHERYLP